MDLPDISKFRIDKRATKETLLCDEVYEYFNKSISYSLIRKWINEIGPQALNDIFREVIKIKGKWSTKGMMVNKIAEHKKNILWE